MADEKSMFPVNKEGLEKITEDLVEGQGEEKKQEKKTEAMPALPASTGKYNPRWTPPWVCWGWDEICATACLILLCCGLTFGLYKMDTKNTERRKEFYNKNANIVGKIVYENYSVEDSSKYLFRVRSDKGEEKVFYSFKGAESLDTLLNVGDSVEVDGKWHKDGMWCQENIFEVYLEDIKKQNDK